jgi:hypothetical protein
MRQASKRARRRRLADGRCYICGKQVRDDRSVENWAYHSTEACCPAHWTALEQLAGAGTDEVLNAHEELEYQVQLRRSEE